MLCAQVDSLNMLSYRYRYISLDTAELYARQAQQLLASRSDYLDGNDEADCHRGFVSFMRMDYDSATVAFRRVLDNSNNQLIQLMADVGMMHVCQRLSTNKEFYDYRNSAEKRIRRIQGEVGDMNDRQRVLWHYALSDFYLTLSIYYYYLRQEDEATAALDAVADILPELRTDTAQTVMFYFLGGNSRHADNLLNDDDMQNILRCISIAYPHRYSYIYSKCFTTLATDLLNSPSVRPSRVNYLRELLALPDSIDNADVPLQLTQIALDELRRYGSLFDVSQTYIAMADCYLFRGDNDAAFQAMQHALDCVNQHHAQVAGTRDSLWLKTYEPDVEGSTEMAWINSRRLPCVPEWMADVREHLCMVYSALGMKAESDYNRNIYLDILDATRQDRQMEQRLESLRADERSVNRTMMVAAIVVLLLIAIVVYFSRRIRASYTANYRKEQQTVESEMKRWRERVDENYSNLEEQQENVVAQRFTNEHRLDEQKQRYIDKTTCLSIVYAIRPFLDRAVNEVAKLCAGEGNTQQRLSYLGELTERINLYNDVLAHWIKIRQGSVSLNIGSFALQPLFDIVGKSTNVFRNKHIELHVEATESVVKADRALTLFMVNTLLENARKYTPEGGEVTLQANQTEQYVEISVTDTGRGLSPEDVQRICGEKVYDSSNIGDVEHDEDLRKNKGSGFGLMNCRGIIEKYRKTNSLFAVCQFGVESELGKGSRFYFRLPKGVVRTLCMTLVALFSAALAPDAKAEQPVAPDSVHIKAGALPVDPLLEQASAYADSAYFANVDGYYAAALMWVDSACHRLNDFYRKQEPDGTLLVHLSGGSEMPEIDLWMAGFTTDYHIILDIRNEAAIAALALRQWDVYYYNNEIYTRLYKLMAQDTTLEQYCNDVEAANTNRQTVLALAVMLLLLGLLIYYVNYYRNHILPMFNLRQILELNRRLFSAESEDRLADIIYEGVNDIRRTDGVCLMRHDGDLLYSDRCPRYDYLPQFLTQCMAQAEEVELPGGRVHLYPLVVEERTIGAMAIIFHSADKRKSDDRLFRLLSQHTAINIYYSSVRIERMNEQIELQDDERRRTENEANHVHVQNMVLDNCLSTIKHETMYYPSRIQQIVTQLQTHGQDALPADKLADMSELIGYYKEVFSLLSACAARQLDTVLFRRRHIPVGELADYARKAFDRQRRKMPHAAAQLEINSNSEPLFVVGDVAMLQYLFDNLLAAFLELPQLQTLRLAFEKDGDFVAIHLSTPDITLSAEHLQGLFYSENLRYDADSDQLHGAQLLVAKQIVREHDAHVRRGCRIYAQPLQADGTGILLCMTIPKTQR